MTEYEKLEKVVEHIDCVLYCCRTLAKCLINEDEFELAKTLIANSYLHDNSKFYGVEWEYLLEDDKKNKKIAIYRHHTQNCHHPEYWNKGYTNDHVNGRGIHNMPDEYVCEMVCDWKARSIEFETSLMDWIVETAMPRFCFGEGDEVYAKIMRYVELLEEI